MTSPLAKSRRPLGIITAIGLVAAGLFFVQPIAAASADTQLPGPAPIEQRNAATVTADPLPTVQIDSGVVWTQVIVGNTVFAGGNFSNARPAGAAAGTNLMPRTDLLSYDINTGVATSFAPTFDGQVKALAVSPDKTTLYVGGTFSYVNGQRRYNVAAFNIATGALLTTFKPAVGGTYVNAIVATNSAVYMTGLIGAGNGVTRKNFAAFSPSNGALLGWAPTSDLQGDAMVLAPAGDKIIVGGRFGLVNGVSQRGLAALDLTTGALLPWLAPATVINGESTGPNMGKAGIFDLTADANSVYGTGWVYADVATGNLEGAFSARGDTGAINWIADCHGDHYGIYSDGTNVYTTSHQHACETMGGAPQSNPSSINLRHSADYTAAVKGTLTRSAYVSNIYADWSGYPAPAAIDWYPDWVTGSFTGDGQAGWDMTGNGTYLVVGGEFPYVNGKLQQGIVRFSNTPAGGPKNGPRWSGNNWTGMTVQSHSAGNVRISIPANWDRDDLTLTYKLLRYGTTGAIQTTTSQSTFWDTPAISFTDTGQTPGSTQQYRITATDPDGNTVNSNWTSVVVSSQNASPYANAVLNDGANLFWRLGTPSGTVETDWASSNNGTIGSTVTPSSTGAISGDPLVGSTFDGTSNGLIYTPNQTTVGAAYSVEFWVNTTTTSGGKIVGYGNASTGDSSNYDRHVYMTNSGQLIYGNYDGNTETITSPASYNDGNWHHVVGTQGPSGMALYIDGNLVGTAGATTAQAYTGYWRVGGDNLNGWPNQPSSEYFNGKVDDFAVYPTVLTASQAATHFALGQGQTAPTAQFTSTPSGLTASFDASGSSVPSGQSIASYTWNFGDSSTGTGVAPAHTYAAGGTYTVSLTVKSSSGLSSTTSGTVTVTAPHAIPIAAISKTTNGLTATFDGTGSSASDGATVTGYLWTFGDGTTSTLAKPVHAYSASNIYPVTLVVTDSLGASSTAASTTVSVTHAAPVAAFTPTPNGLGVSVNGTASTSSDGATLSYDWNWGDGSAHGSGATATHSYSSAGTKTVTLTVSDSYGSSNSTTAPVTVSHAAPVAAFTPTISGLGVSVNAAASTGSDGATLSYDWDWGDGSAHGTGVTATHSYASAAARTVTLTVSDSFGLSSTATAPVNTAHSAPVAAFLVTPSGLGVSVNASGSTASDGATLSYDWNWGDGSAHGSGVTATHTYAGAGTDTITLTVTDSLGSSASKAIPVTVSSIVYVASDDFTRTVTGGWGTAPIGGTWSGTTGLSVAGGVGVLTGTTSSTRTTYLSGASAKDLDARVLFSNNVLANGGGTHFNFVVRHTAAGDYHLKVRISATGVVTVNVAKTVGTTETLFTGKTLAGYTYVPGDVLALRFNLVTVGSSTTLNGKVWLASTAEPAAWTTTVSDAQPELQTAGQVGISTYITGTVTNGPLATSVDSLTVQ